MRKARLISFYLPQYYPISENDAWWGKGFTEWRNVVTARPFFRGHDQPHIPADLGFYDLRVPESRAAQADLAREYGIEGFCYWHYWFAGKSLLERPLSEVLKSGQPDFPFCLGWANESWTGVWHNCPDKILIEQTYPGKEDEEKHFYNVLTALADKRYIRIEEKPVFYVYNPHLLPKAKRFTDHWQHLAQKEGLKGIYFIGEDHTLNWNPLDYGFDASVPHSPGLAYYKLALGSMLLKIRYLYRWTLRKPGIFPYKKYINLAQHKLSDNFTQFPSVVPNWDNTPRCGVRGFVLADSTPELFRLHLRRAIEQVSRRPFDKRVIFIKSWNEWAEGNYMEPDLKFGRAYLEACKAEVIATDR